MKLLIIGGGGREHALAWKLAATPGLTALYCAPGNAGTATCAINIPIASIEIADIVTFAVDHAIDFVVIGPERPLVLGLVDALEAAGIAAFGPSATAARLEGSKGFVKDLCRDHHIPTAAYRRVASQEEAESALVEFHLPVVIKLDGLAAGKGVTIATSHSEARQAIANAFAETNDRHNPPELVIEEFLTGPEISFFVLSDGIIALPFASAGDYKRALDGDQGPNTGGMGAYAPSPLLTPQLEAEIMATIIQPTILAMAKIGAPFKGVLYAGLMLTEAGPQLLEYNVRFGDPECQALMLRLKSDLLPLLLACSRGTLTEAKIKWRDGVAVAVVMAANGYPGAFQIGDVIEGLDKPRSADVEIFHAGTHGLAVQPTIASGRVLGVTALGSDYSQARDKAYKTVSNIACPNLYYRHDIAAGIL